MPSGGALSSIVELNKRMGELDKFISKKFKNIPPGVIAIIVTNYLRNYEKKHDLQPLPTQEELFAFIGEWNPDQP